MKKMLFSICLAVSLCMGGCGNPESSGISKADGSVSVDSFSYAEDSARWGTIGVCTSGFQNTTVQTVDNGEQAIALAKREAVVSYDLVDVAFDEMEKMWKVTFWTENQAGGGQRVYLNADGITQASIFGE